MEEQSRAPPSPKQKHRSTPQSLPKLIIPKYTSPPPEEITLSCLANYLDRAIWPDQFRTEFFRRKQKCREQVPQPLPAATPLPTLFPPSVSRERSNGEEDIEEEEEDIIVFKGSPSPCSSLSSIDTIDFTARDREIEWRAWAQLHELAAEHDRLRERYYSLRRSLVSPSGVSSAPSSPFLSVPLSAVGVDEEGNKEEEEEEGKEDGCKKGEEYKEEDNAGIEEGEEIIEVQHERKEEEEEGKTVGDGISSTEEEKLDELRKELEMMKRRRQQVVHIVEGTLKRRRVRREFRQDFNPIWRRLDG